METVAMVEVGGAHDFWERAPGLLQEIDAIGAALVSSPSTDLVRSPLHRFAAAIPKTPGPLGDMDPYLRDALLTGVIHALRSQSDDDRRETRIAVERIRQALRDALDERPVWQGGSKAAALWLKERALRVQDVAAMTGASPTTVRRWFNEADATAPSGALGDKVIVLAKIVNHLRHAMTVRGVVQWLGRPNAALDDRTPVEELKDPESYRQLVHLASGTRSFVAT